MQGPAGAQGPQGPQGIQGPKGDPTYVRTIVVSPVEGNDVASGDRLLAAVASITDATGLKRYLIKLEPGQYKVSSSLVLKSYVDIEGSGEYTSVIYSDGSLPTATVIAVASTELRWLGLSQSGSNTDTETALSLNNVASVILDHVRLNASGGPEAVALDVVGSFSGLTVRDSQIDASHTSPTTAGTAIAYRQSAGFVDVERTRFTVFAGPYPTYGVVNNGGRIDLSDSEISVYGPGGAPPPPADMKAIANHGSAQLYIRNSYLYTLQGSTSSTGIDADGGIVRVDRSTIATNGTNAVRQSGSALVDVAASGLSSLASYTPGGANIRCVFTYFTGTALATSADCA